MLPRFVSTAEHRAAEARGRQLQRLVWAACDLPLGFAPPALEVASTVKEGHDAHNLRLDVVQQALAKDKDLACIGPVALGDDAAAAR